MAELKQSARQLYKERGETITERSEGHPLAK